MSRNLLEFRSRTCADPVSNFLLTHGREFRIGPETFAGPRMERGACFQNATHFSQAREGIVVYVEGFVTVYGVPIHHAWCATPDGLAIDPTIDNHDGRVCDYFGVAFSTRYVLRTAFKNRVYGVLDHHYNRRTIDDLLTGKAEFSPANFFKESK